VDDDDIARALAAGGEAQTVANALISLALQAGGQDNVSVQLLAVQDEAADGIPSPASHETAASASLTGKPVATEPRRGISTFFLLLPLILVVVLAAILLPWGDWLAPAPARSEPARPEKTTPQTPPAQEPDATDPFAAAGTEPAAPAFPTAAPETARPQAPRITIVIPPGLAQPEVKQRVVREYPGNWSSPETLEDRLAGSLAQGRIYYRPGFGPASAHLAQELGYAAVPWPEGLAREHPEADLLVVYGGTP
jgi:hypothetical protein